MDFHLYAATSNQGKLRDFRTAAAAHSLVIETLPKLKEIPAPEEDGLTFAANATLKAVYYSRFAPGELVVSDDSGLEVDALKGAPGVHSARFAADAGFTGAPGENNTLDERNNLLLLQQMVGLPAAQRTARYRCVLAVARDGKILYTTEGAVEGMILEAGRGRGGFGYDPLFYLPELHRSMAEIDLETKNTLSHRGRAFAALLPRLLSCL
jgi:XTP/dITP diphosphohydrolase